METIHLSKNNIVHKVFRWSERLSASFRGRCYPYESNLTNLCYLMRRIFVYTPLILLLQVISVIAPIYALCVYPAMHYGASYWMISGGIIGFIVVIIGLLFLCFEISDHVNRKKAINGVLKQRKPKKKKREPNFLDVFLAYLIAKKRELICPFVELGDDDETN